MCGIVGMAGLLHSEHSKMFRDMLLFDTVRGIDSTGVVHIPAFRNAQNGKQILVEKGVGLPDTLWDDPKSKIFNSRGHVQQIGKALIGHNRAATVGDVTYENSHPFVFDNIYGVHNGSLRTYVDLENALSHPVDSMALIEHIKVHGVGDAWKNFHGAAAVVWWDDEDSTINFARNSERPLVYAYSAKGNALFWASELWMILVAANRNKVELEKKKDDEGKETKEVLAKTFNVETHYKFKVETNDVKLVSRSTLEKKPYATTIGKNTPQNTTVMGFGRSGYTVNRRGNGKSKRAKQMNDGWAKGMKKGDKDTRGVQIKIKSFNHLSGSFAAKFDPPIEGKEEDFILIYPTSQVEVDKIQAAFKKGNQWFKTRARMRYQIRPGYKIWGISSVGLVPSANLAAVPKVSRKTPEGEVPLFKSHRGDYVPEEEWKSQFKSNPAGCSCLWCGNPLDIQDHEEIYYLSREDALCPDCGNDEGTLRDVMAFNPNYTYPRGKENVG